MSLDTLDGTLARIIFNKPSAWNPAGVPFLIGKLTNGVIIKGEMRKPVEYERYRFYGEMRPQKGKPGEEAFEFSSYEVIIDQSIDGYARYLSEYITGIGPAKAKALVEHLGTDALTILRATPDRAAEVEGITPKIVEAIKTHFESEYKVDPVAFARLIEMFAPFKVPKSVVKDLVATFGSSAPDWVKENPYSLMAYPRIGWETADSFAITVCQYDPNGIERHKCAIVEGIERLTSNGNTYGRKVEIEGEVHKLLGIVPRDDAWDELVAEQRIVKDAEESDRGFGGYTTYTTPALHFAEITIAERLAALIEAAKPLPFEIDTSSLLGEQIEAVRLIEASPVAILTGPPGTGKSVTAANVVSGLIAGGVREIKYVAPTGKAAKRGGELLQKCSPGCGITPSTIHRALGPKPNDEKENVRAGAAKVNRGRSEFGFTHNEDNPMEVDFLIVDETSMVDVKLMAALLTAIPLGTRILFVGDHNQLPSVGPGEVLYDMMRSGVPTACLTEIRRSTPGRVVQACHDIKDGKIPVPAKKLDFDAGDNWVHIECSDPNEIASIVAKLHKPGNVFKDLLWDFQVISAQRGRHAFACDNLNAILSKQINPPDESEGQGSGSGGQPPFRPGDKIVRTKNGAADELNSFMPEKKFRADWEWDGDEYTITEGYVVNGDMGIVKDVVVDGRGGHAVVGFTLPDRLCRLPYGESHLSLAYAMTVHRCQGSGFPLVIFPVHTSIYKELLTRELVYTGISRTEIGLITVGEFSAIESAVGRKRAGSRLTRLRDRIRATQLMEAVA